LRLLFCDPSDFSEVTSFFGIKKRKKKKKKKKKKTAQIPLPINEIRSIISAIIVCRYQECRRLCSTRRFVYMCCPVKALRF